MAPRAGFCQTSSLSDRHSSMFAQLAQHWHDTDTVTADDQEDWLQAQAQLVVQAWVKAGAEGRATGKAMSKLVLP